MQIDQIKCPCCLSSNFISICRVTGKDSALKMAPTIDEEIVLQLEQTIQKGWGSDYALWYRCNKCGSGFALPFSAATPDFYNITYRGESFYTKWKWDYQVTYEAIKSLKKGKLLEIGAGNGMFINKVVNSIFDPKDILCTEFSEYGRKEISNKGVRCVSKDILSLVNPEFLLYFDVICMFQVLEHIDNLDKTFEALYSIASANCSLFIAVPNHKHRDFFDTLGEHLDTPPVHITCFTPKGLEILAARHNWQIIEHRYQPTKRIAQTLEFIHNKFQKNKKLNLRVNNIQNKILRKFLFLTFLAILLLFNIKAIINLNIGKKGVAQWFWLKKIK